MEEIDNEPIPLEAFPSIREECIDPDTKAVDYNRLIAWLFEIIKRIDPSLDLSSMKTVSAGPSYKETLAEVAARVGRPLQPTERESGSGFAMLVHDKEGDILVTSLGVLEAVFGTDPEARDLMLHMIHHELCHGHDAAVFRRTFPGLSLSEWRGPGWFHRLRPVSTAVWSEYSANRRSFATLPGQRCFYSPMLVTEIGTVKDAVKAAIGSFRQHKQVGALLDAVAPHMEFLFALIGYTLGDIDGGGGNVDPDLKAALRGSYIEAAWQAVGPHLDYMYRTNGSWPGLEEVYQPLDAAVRSTFAELGLVMQMRPQGCYLAVPFEGGSTS